MLAYKLVRLSAFSVHNTLRNTHRNAKWCVKPITYVLSQRYADVQHLQTDVSPYHHHLRGLKSWLHNVPKYTSFIEHVSHHQFGFPTCTAIQLRHLNAKVKLKENSPRNNESSACEEKHTENVIVKETLTSCDEQQTDFVNNLKQKTSLDLRELVSKLRLGYT